MLSRKVSAALVAGTILLLLMTLLVCLIPKPENDLFFELRIGSDILHSQRLPHVDSYSWVNRGTNWDVPEWLAFVLYALAFRAGGFFGTWLLMVVLTLAAVETVWFRLARRIGIAWAFQLATLLLLALNPCLQERPYAFTYLLLPISLWILLAGREGCLKILLWLAPLCALWANLHQGVVVLIGILLVYALGDALTALWFWREEMRAEPPDLLLLSAWEMAARDAEEGAKGWRRHARQAGLMTGTAALCAAFATLSPYGWHLYRNVWITVRDPTLMSNVTEWNSVAVLPLVQLQPFLLVSAVTLAYLMFSRRRNFADALVLAALFDQSLLHARNISLFALGSFTLGAPHIASCLGDLRRVLGLSSRSPLRNFLLCLFALMYAGAFGLVGAASLQKAIGPRGYTLPGIGEAVARVPSYPENACAFMERENFPPNLRLLNNFEIGGYLMWRLPSEPVFVDGRLDVYAGKTFEDMLTLSRGRRSPEWVALVQRYDFDCVMTTSEREAAPFVADPQWQLVYSDPPQPHHLRCRILLRRRPEFAALIARCLRDHPLDNNSARPFRAGPE